MDRAEEMLFVGIASLFLAGAASAATSGDAYIKRTQTEWILGTASVEKIIALDAQKLRLKSFRQKSNRHEWVSDRAESDEFVISLGNSGDRLSGSSGGWQLLDAQETKLKQGELQLDLTLGRGPIVVTKSYVVYPASSIIREWVTFKNAGTAPIQVSEPGFLNLSLHPDTAGSIDFHWMSGGENYPGSWKLKTEALPSEKSRKFDSYEPFPVDTNAVSQFPGDGVNAKILLNDTQVWPQQGWQYVANGTVRAPFGLALDIKPGDKLVFLVNMNKSIGFDTTAFDPTIVYEDGEAHTASKEFSREQGKNRWRYQYIEQGKFIDLVYYPGPNQWRKQIDNATGTPFVGPADQHPDNGQDVARVWTAPKAGRVRVSGSVCNTGNGGGSTAYGLRPGSASYAPWYALYGKNTKAGLFIGWDYFGHWNSSFTLGRDGDVTAQLRVAGHKQILAPGEFLTTPKAFVGLFQDDLDNAGNECLDWQYRYLWDYTRPGWFPAIRMLGYWMNGTTWQSGAGWTGGGPDWESTFRKIFRVADLMRYVGADVYHRDWGWWDRAGDWNGPDFRTTINYLHKYGMGQLIYAFLYTVDETSRVAKQHPEWLLGSTLDMSRPEVVQFIKGQLDMFVERWGDFEWRNDSSFTAARSGDDTPMLGQDEGFRRILRDFLDQHPKSAFQAVNGGGNYGGYDYTRYSSSFSFSDGAVGILRNYYASLLFPPDKTSDIPDVWDPKNFDKSTWRGLLCINFDMTGDTWDPAKLEGIRELIDIYHYLQKQGVVGRWVHVFRPVIMGDDPAMYLQRLSRDGKRGILIPKRPASGATTIKPKGLRPRETYAVSFHESTQSQTRRGADLMENGIFLEKMPPGELIYLNLPLHPGSKLDTQPPTAPSEINKQRAENMGYPGIELSWKAASDNNWISYYEIFRNGRAIDKVAKGTFYFDHSAGADLAATYEVRAVDGAGNASLKKASTRSSIKPARVFDDAAGNGFAFSGVWQSEANLQPAHAGTISASKQEGALAELAFEGKRVLLFSKLGANCGKARVTIDGSEPEIIDTYSADDIWGVCVYRKELPVAGPHNLRIEVLGDHAERAKDVLVYIDGVRVED